MQLTLKDGHSPVTSALEVTSWLKSSSGGLVDPKSVSQRMRCCVCLRGAPFFSTLPHHGGECQLLNSFNKTRAAAGIRPILLNDDVVDSEAKKKTENLDSVKKDLDKRVKDVTAAVASLTKRVESLELKKGKRKGAPASSSDSSTAAKKAKKGGSTAAKPAQSGSTAKSGSTTAKGKGKTKGKTAAQVVSSGSGGK